MFQSVLMLLAPTAEPANGSELWLPARGAKPQAIATRLSPAAADGRLGPVRWGRARLGLAIVVNALGFMLFLGGLAMLLRLVDVLLV